MLITDSRLCPRCYWYGYLNTITMLFYWQAISSVHYLTPAFPASSFPINKSHGPPKLLCTPYILFWPIWATGSATWAYLMAPCGFPLQVEYRPVVHLPSCSRKTGGWSCLCGLLPQSGKLVHLGYNGLSHQYVVQERLWRIGLQHGFPIGSHGYFLEACCALQ